MKLSELYSQLKNHTKVVDFQGGKIEVKLFMEKEAEALEGKELHEQLAVCIVEDNKTLDELGFADSLRDNMPLAHKKELMELIMTANGINVSFDEKKSD